MELELEIEVQRLITERLIAFHEALVERGQISRSTPGFGITDGCKEDRASCASQSLQKLA
jgi:hypothetical protein